MRAQLGTPRGTDARSSADGSAADASRDDLLCCGRSGAALGEHERHSGFGLLAAMALLARVSRRRR